MPLGKAGYRAASAFLRALQQLCSHCQAETFQRFFSKKFCLGGDLLNLSVGAVVCRLLDPLFIGGGNQKTSEHTQYVLGSVMSVECHSLSNEGDTGH